MSVSLSVIMSVCYAVVSVRHYNRCLSFCNGLLSKTLWRKKTFVNREINRPYVKDTNSRFCVQYFFLCNISKRLCTFCNKTCRHNSYWLIWKTPIGFKIKDSREKKPSNFKLNPNSNSYFKQSKIPGKKPSNFKQNPNSNSYFEQNSYSRGDQYTTCEV